MECMDYGEHQAPARYESGDGCLTTLVRIPVRIVVLVLVLPVRMVWDALVACARAAERALLRPLGRALSWLFHVLVAVPAGWLWERVLTPLGHGLRWLARAVFVWPWTALWRYVVVPGVRYGIVVPLGWLYAAVLTPLGHGLRWVCLALLAPAGRGVLTGIGWLLRAVLVLPVGRVAIRPGAPGAGRRLDGPPPGRRARPVGVPRTAHPAGPRHRLAPRSAGPWRRRRVPGAVGRSPAPGAGASRHPAGLGVPTGARPRGPGGRGRVPVRLARRRIRLAGRRPGTGSAGVVPGRGAGGLGLPHGVHPVGHLVRRAVWAPVRRAAVAAGRTARDTLRTARETVRQARRDAWRALVGGQPVHEPREPDRRVARTLGSTTTVPSAAPEPEISLHGGKAAQRG